MAEFSVDGKSKPGILHLVLKGTFTLEEMQAFVRQHNAAIDAFAGAEYRVFCDIRDMKPLSPEAAEVLAQGKSYSDAHKNFQGSAVWVTMTITAMQHKRTSQDAGVGDTELISADEDELWAHLKTVRRHG